MSQAVIRTDSLTKYYGKNRGVLELSFEVRPGEVFGFLGPNGAGKTTTIRVLMDFIRPTEGVAQVFGLDSQRDSVEIRRRVGYLPGELALYDNLTAGELLRHFAHLRGGVEWGYVRELAARLDLGLRQRISSLSQGNKRKVGLVQALMHRPELLLLDEPTNGLDPLVQQEFYRLVSEVKAEGRTIFLSSHNLPEVERVCDRVGVIRLGRLVAVEEIEALKRRAFRQLEIHFAQPVPAQAFEDVQGVRDVRVDDGVLQCSVVGSLDGLVKKAAQFEVVNIVSHEPSLEQIFLAYYGGGMDDVA
ncbi:MAG: ABC transporter ATP-binding protein [Anaerolineae bacterium]|nr:ABC transporter ATP-binding protein [Anaerolineae bacterium]